MEEAEKQFLKGVKLLEIENYAKAKKKFSSALKSLTRTIPAKDWQKSIYSNSKNTIKVIFSPFGELWNSLKWRFDLLFKKPRNSSNSELLKELILFERGVCYKELGNLKRANEDISKAIELNGRDSNYFLERSLVLKDQYIKKNDTKSLKSAIKDVSKGIKIDVENDELYSARGSLYQLQKEFRRSLEDHNQAISLATEYNKPIYLNNRATCFLEMEEHSKAIDDFTTAIELDPKFSTALVNRAESYYLERNFENVIHDCDKALSINKRNSKALLIRGNAFRNLGQFELAEKDYSKSFENEKDNLDVLVAIGRMYFHRREYEKADYYFSDVIRKSKSNSTKLTIPLDLILFERMISNELNKKYFKAMKDAIICSKSKYKKQFLKQAESITLMSCKKGISLDNSFICFNCNKKRLFGKSMMEKKVFSNIKIVLY